MYHLGPKSHPKVIVFVLQRQCLLMSLFKVSDNSHSTMLCCSVVLAPATPDPPALRAMTHAICGIVAKSNNP